MNLTLRISLVFGLCIYFYCIYKLLIRKNLNLKYSLLWILSGICMGVIVAFPDILNRISGILGIVDVTNALFMIVLFFIMIILMSLTAIVSKLRNQNRRLIQKAGLLEKRLNEMKSQVIDTNSKEFRDSDEIL